MTPTTEKPVTLESLLADGARKLAEKRAIEAAKEETMTTEADFPAPHTHTGYRPHIGYRGYRGRNFGHQDQKPGAVHALVRWGAGYRSLCGMIVPAYAENNVGDDSYDRDVQGAGRHVFPAGELKVTCKRCLEAR